MARGWPSSQSPPPIAESGRLVQTRSRVAEARYSATLDRVASLGGQCWPARFRGGRRSTPSRVGVAGSRRGWTRRSRHCDHDGTSGRPPVEVGNLTGLEADPRTTRRAARRPARLGRCSRSTGVRPRPRDGRRARDTAGLPVEPPSGNAHEHQLKPLERFAASLGFTASFETIDGPEMHGSADALKRPLCASDPGGAAGGHRA
jgi:hypothetical protein